jgi:mRNA-degrading endonuclease RelE of RelBE toxin-antitoxin system
MNTKFLIKIEKKVDKQILKYDINIRKRIIKKIQSLEKIVFPKNPKHILATKGNSFLCEMGFDTIRIYYKFTLKEIVIYEIKYEGKVNIFDIQKGKGTQQQKINNMVKKFKVKDYK